MNKTKKNNKNSLNKIGGSQINRLSSELIREISNAHKSNSNKIKIRTTSKKIRNALQKNINRIKNKNMRYLFHHPKNSDHKKGIKLFLKHLIEKNKENGFNEITQELLYETWTKPIDDIKIRIKFDDKGELESLDLTEIDNLNNDILILPISIRDIKVKIININYKYLNENINNITSNILNIMGDIDDENIEIHDKLMNEYNFPNVNFVYWTTIDGNWTKKKGINYPFHISCNTFTNLNVVNVLTSL